MEKETGACELFFVCVGGGGGEMLESPNQRSWIVCVCSQMVCTIKTTRDLYLVYGAQIRLSPWSRVARSILVVRMCNSQKFLGPKTNVKIIHPLLMDNFSEFGNLQIFRK